MDRDIDVELLISLVKDRPVLWNKSLEQYKSRNATVDAWRDVCWKLHEEFEYFSEEERSDFGKYVVKKWTNVKDSWVKAQKRVSGNKSGYSKPKRKYIYQDKLHFLKDYFGPGSKDVEVGLVDFKVENEDSDLVDSLSPLVSQATSVESVSFSNTPRPWNRFKKWKPDGSQLIGTNSTSDSPDFGAINPLDSPELRTINPLEMESPELRTINPLESPELRTCNSLEVPEDRHISFFKGILPSLHQLNEEETLQFQMGVLNVLHEIRTAKSLFVEPLSSSVSQ